MIGELNSIQIENILSSQVLGRLACSDRKQPYIVPVTYVYDGQYIYGQTNDGRKLEILRKNAFVCFEVDNMTDMRNWQSVIIFKFEELNDVQEEIARTYSTTGCSRFSPAALHPFQHTVTASIEDKSRIKNIMYRILITEQTGRFEKQ